MIVLGPPGSDRAAVAGLVAARLGVPATSLGDVVQAELRAHTPAAVEAVRHMNAGETVPERVLLTMIRDRLARPDTAAGFVLDGFPNHVVRAASIDALLADLGTTLDRAIDLVLSDAEVLRRLSGRRTCRRCGQLWHTLFAPPARSDVCDRCGGGLFRREDDRPERVTAGMLSYRPATAPTLDHYRTLGKLHSVDGTLPVAEIVAAALA
ncbi:nucleoside monophosphate kinase [Micromonospora sp. NBC_00898]|uniref:adenylate kinase family protein n=1 Tax=Micromonospora sp. NBC_00898 TaxID=2975981 RepID=UPI00386C2783|nr:nucleoside monophosphate kinase [Micromonospora sp. NBC_00898]